EEEGSDPHAKKEDRPFPAEAVTNDQGEAELRVAMSVLITRPVGEFNEKRQLATTESLPTVQAVLTC
ncbi:MAG: hypothetical protein D3918_16690, partial [Candidatus Electrothrix sp. AX2]|nr:hypothetical protein [Candidatus Electrothrix gigas]